MNKNIIALIVCVVIVLSSSAGHCFTDKRYGYSIQFPKGWKVEKVNVSGQATTQATSAGGTQIVTTAVKQEIPGFVATHEFAKYYAFRVTLPLGKQVCSEAHILSAYAGEFNNHDAIVNVMQCDENKINTTSIISNGITYTMSVVYNESDKQGYQAMTKSIKTFKLLH